MWFFTEVRLVAYLTRFVELRCEYTLAAIAFKCNSNAADSGKEVYESKFFIFFVADIIFLSTFALINKQIT
jgi:hypothetical protein